MPTERFTFEGHDGHALAARLDLPDGPVLATALFAHCFTCGKDIAAARRIADRLTALGLAVLRFDFTGLGHSGGEFANTTFSSNVADIKAACAALTARDLPPSLLIGHSLGGAAVLRAAADMTGIKAVATIAAPFDPAHVMHHFADSHEAIHRDGSAKVQLAGRPFTIGKGFLDDIARSELTGALGRMRAALLVLHAPRDDMVGIDNATEIFRAAKHPKSFVTLGDADHLLSQEEDAHYAAEVIAAWAGRYLDLRRPAPPPGAPEGVLCVREADPDGFLQDIQSGAHHLQADEPESYGGTDRGLSPYGLLSAALGACTSMTLRMYAKRKGWPLETVQVDIAHDKMHAQDASVEANSRIDRFTRTITLTGALDADQRQRLLEIAEKCPVHQTLERTNRIETTLAD